MRDLLQEVRELEEAVKAQEDERLRDWLRELLDIKKARLSVEVFLTQDFSLEPEPEIEEETRNLCPRCRSDNIWEAVPQGHQCRSCGWVGFLGGDDDA
jgi:hypothetical protein